VEYNLLDKDFKGVSFMIAKEAAKSLYEKKEITSEEYNEIIKCADIIDDLEKTAAGTLARLLPTLQGGAVGLGLGAGVAAVGSELYNKLKQQADIKKSYNLMSEKMPVLNEYPQDKIKDYFEVVKIFSPLSASNPLVAGALVHKMLEFGGVDHKLIQDISNIRSNEPSGFLFEVAKSTVGGLSKIHKESPVTNE
jgi:hypothetical protein